MNTWRDTVTWLSVHMIVRKCIRNKSLYIVNIHVCIYGIYPYNICIYINIEYVSKYSI